MLCTIVNYALPHYAAQPSANTSHPPLVLSLRQLTLTSG
jgi:hypothetical protein